MQKKRKADHKVGGWGACVGWGQPFSKCKIRQQNNNDKKGEQQD